MQNSIPVQQFGGIRFFEPGNHFSEHLFVAKCTMSEVDNYLKDFTKYLLKFKEMLDLKKPSGLDTSEYHDFDSYMTKLDPVAGYLSSNFGKEKSEQFVNDFLLLNLNNTNGFWKYEEDKTLKEIEQYISSTYHSHYTSEQSKTQTLDLIESIGDAEAFTRSNAIKYLSRFGKKNGKSKMDILKAIHYCVLLYHFAGLHKNTNGGYETF